VVLLVSLLAIPEDVTKLGLMGPESHAKTRRLNILAKPGDVTRTMSLLATPRDIAKT